MAADIPMQLLLALLVYGPINWIVTVILTESFLFEEPRNGMRQLGRKLHGPRWGWLGKKIAYLPTCAMCTGVWVGLVIAVICGGPIQDQHPVLNVVINGLLFKAIGHLYLQMSAWLHWRIETLKPEIEVAVNGHKSMQRIG